MRKNNRKRKGGFLMTTGLLLIAAALLLTLYNDREQKLADAQAAAALSRLRVTIPEAEEEQDAPVLSDERGNPLDWPLDAKGEPMPWPVAEDGMPVPGPDKHAQGCISPLCAELCGIQEEWNNGDDPMPELREGNQQQGPQVPWLRL